MDEMILYEVDDRVATVTLNRPEKLNAITPTLQRELLAALRRAADDDGVRVAVVRGAGRGFCAGYDVTSGEMAARGVPADRLQLEAVLRGWLEIWDLPLPVIAQVHGVCLAGGTQLAAICDVTIVADDARIGTPQLPLGAGYVASFWAWFVGPKKAKEVFFETGATVSADEAVAMGLFNRVVPAAELDEHVHGLRPRRGPPAEGPARPAEAGDQPHPGGAGLPPGAAAGRRGRRHRPRLAGREDRQPPHRRARASGVAGRVPPRRPRRRGRGRAVRCPAPSSLAAPAPTGTGCAHRPTLPWR